MTNSEMSEWFEYGYRLADGTEVWEIDHGTDGSWTPFDPERRIDAIDMYDGGQVKAIYKALDKAGAEGVAIRKRVARTEGATESIERDGTQS